MHDRKDQPMKPFARMKLSSAALRRGILVSSLAFAAAVEWLIIKYRNPIREFMIYDSHVSVVLENGIIGDDEDG